MVKLAMTMSLSDLFWRYKRKADKLIWVVAYPFMGYFCLLIN